MWALLLAYRSAIPVGVAGLLLVRWLRRCGCTAKCLIFVWSLYHVYLLVFPPYDLFIDNNLDILAPDTHLRAALGDYSSLPLEDMLLRRLKVLDNRYLYARLGHRPLLECLWCTYPVDYFIFAVPRILLPYVCEAVVLGVLGWRVVGGPGAEVRAERWRGMMAWTLLGAAVGEIGVKCGWEVVAVRGDCDHVGGISYI